MKKTETAVIIPNFNGKQLLQTCIESLKKQSYSNFSIFVVDDGSTDDSVSFLKNTYPEIEIIKNNKNIGFSKSVTKALKIVQTLCQPEYIALLNNDTETDPNWLKELIKKIQESKDIAGVASNMLFYDKRNVINSHGCKLTPFLNGEDINKNVIVSQVKPPEFVLGCCFGAALIKTSTLESIGLLDARYHSYGEDTDWGWRANILGYKIAFCNEAVVYHWESSTSDKYFSSYFKSYQCRKNMLCNAIKNLEAKSLLKKAPLLFSYYLVFSGAYIINIKIVEGKFRKITDLSFVQRIPFILMPLRSVSWNAKHIKETLRKRGLIQKKREVSDKILKKEGLLP